jgi:hypothetical protein
MPFQHFTVRAAEQGGELAGQAHPCLKKAK